MKIGSYKRDGQDGYGVFTDDGIVDLGPRIGSKYPDLLSLLQADALGEAAGAADGQSADFGIDAIEFVPLIPAPVNIYCAGVNYMDHVKETGRDVPPFPTTFMKLQQSLVGHDQPILKPKVSDQFDFEAEYCAVIGKTARHVDKADYKNHVAGYTCLLDGSIRDFQRRAVDHAGQCPAVRPVPHHDGLKRGVGLIPTPAAKGDLESLGGYEHLALMRSASR